MDYVRGIRSKGVPEDLVFLGFAKERCVVLIDANAFLTPRFYGFPVAPLIHHVASRLRNPERKEIANDMKEYCI